MRMRTALESVDHTSPQTAEDAPALRQAWQPPRLRMLAAKEAEADHGGIHFDGLGFIS
jgi:hypothetical protein